MTRSSVATFRLRALMRRSVALGVVILILSFLGRRAIASETELINKVLLFGVLVIVPLGLSVASRDKQEWNSFLLRFIARAQLPFAAMVALSFQFDYGVVAALLTTPWLILTGLMAIYGLVRLLDPPSRAVAEVSVSAGLIFVAIGGFWLIISRLGIQPMGFGETIILLTAVHFHFAGFAAPILAGLAGRTLPQPKQARLPFILVVAGLITGTPLVAAGISFSPPLALAGTLVITTALFLLSVLVIGWVVPRLRDRAAQALLIVSSLAPLVSMVLASLYAYSLVTKKLIVDIPQMARSHGIINAFGFSLCGLLAWWLLCPED